MALPTRQTGWWLWNINPLSLLLWPVSILFCGLVKIRILLYRQHILKTEKLPLPVIVVGNISLGGNGKTPFVVSLVKLLKDKGFHPAILTRGYKSDYEHETTILTAAKNSEKAGDEANMLSELCAVPIGIGANRIKSARTLLSQFPQTDVLVADDGLQHYALGRDIEIIVQRQRASGNGFCLPAGPLREPVSRLKQADLLIDRDGAELSEQFAKCWKLTAPDQQCQLSDFQGQTVYAMAGIGFPELFFEALRRQGITLQTRSFSDHETFTKQHLVGLHDAPLLVTHKDAVKLRPFATDNIWVVPLELTLSDDLQYQLLSLLETKPDG